MQSLSDHTHTHTLSLSLTLRIRMLYFRITVRILATDNVEVSLFYIRAPLSLHNLFDKHCYEGPREESEDGGCVI